MSKFSQKPRPNYGLAVYWNRKSGIKFEIKAIRKTEIYKKQAQKTSKFQLTLWEPGYNIFMLWNRPKTSSCQLPYQCHRSSTDCTGRLFKCSNRSVSLL